MLAAELRRLPKQDLSKVPPALINDIMIRDFPKTMDDVNLAGVLPEL